jgi:hypothetical protein
MATSRVVYGITADLMTSEVSDDEFKSYHSLVLTGLQLEESYYCQIFAVSEITGEEIHSEIMWFTTGKEITLQNLFDNCFVEFYNLQKQELLVGNNLGETEILNTLEPDAVGDVSNDAVFSAHVKVEISAMNTIDNDFDYSVTP